MAQPIDHQSPVLSWYELMAERDWVGLRALVDPEIDFRVAEGFANGGRYAGAAAVFDEYFPGATTAWERMTPVVDQVIAAGEWTIVLGRYVGVTRETKTDFDVEYAHVWRTDGKRLLELRQYADTAVFRDRVAGITS